MKQRIGRALAVVSFTAALLFGGVTVTQARNGADDGPGHHKNEHHKCGNHKGGKNKKGHHKKQGNRGEDKHHQSGGKDDGPNHDAGDDHGEHGPGHD